MAGTGRRCAMGIILASLFLLISAAKAQSVDFNKPYNTVRSSLIRSGWIPAAKLDKYNKSTCSYEREWWCDLPEYTTCSSTGNGACDTLWISPDKNIYSIGNDANSMTGNRGRTAQTYSPRLATWLCNGSGVNGSIDCSSGTPRSKRH